MVPMVTLNLFQVKDDAKNGFYVENLTEEYVTSYEDINQILIKVGNNKAFRLNSGFCVHVWYYLLNLVAQGIHGFSFMLAN